MKKSMICLLVIAGLTSFSSAMWASLSYSNGNAINEQETILSVSSGSTYTVSCIRFTNVGTARTRGVYDPDDNTITINGKTYQVRVNPYHGDGTKRGDYYYMAGEWFFNL